MEYENYGAGYAVYYGKMTATFETYWNSDEFQVFHVEQKDELIKAIDHERDGRGVEKIKSPINLTSSPIRTSKLS